MTEDQFWDLIAQSGAKQTFGCKLLQKVRAASPPTAIGDRFLARLRTLLNDLPPTDIKDFKVNLDCQLGRAYTWGLWGAAYIMMSGCSDDGFEYWRAWLISQGRAVFDEAIANPESLAALNLGSPDDMDLEALLFVASEIFEAKTGGDLDEELAIRDHPSDPAGEPWGEGGTALQSRFPLLWARYR